MYESSCFQLLGCFLKLQTLTNLSKILNFRDIPYTPYAIGNPEIATGKQFRSEGKEAKNMKFNDDAMTNRSWQEQFFDNKTQSIWKVI